MGGGAWPFLVGGVICLVNSANERDSVLLNSFDFTSSRNIFLEGLATLSRTRLSNNRSVMPLDVLGLSPTQLECTLSGMFGSGVRSLPKSVVFHSRHSMVRGNLERRGHLAVLWFTMVRRICGAAGTIPAPYIEQE